MSESEKSIDAGLEVQFSVKENTASVDAAANRTGEQLRTGIEAKVSGIKVGVTADQKAIGGFGDTLAKQIADASAKVTFNFSGLVKSNADVQTLEASLRSMLAVSEKAGQALQATFSSGSGRGGPSFKVTAKDDVAVALESIQRHRAEFPNDPMKFSVSGKAHDEADYSAAAKAFQGITQAAKPAAKELTNFEKALEFLGQGRPQRAVSTLATGMLTPLLGETAGGLLGGASGLVLGGMMFQVGYQLTKMLENIPSAILNVIEQNQNIDVARARAASLPLGNLAPSTLTPVVNTADKKLMGALGIGDLMFHRLDTNGKGGEDFKSALGMTTTEFMGTIKDPKERAAELDRLIEEAKNAEFGVLGAGMQESTTQIARAQAALRLHGSSAAAGTLMGLTGMKEFMVGQERINMQSGKSVIPHNLSDEDVFGAIQKQISDKLHSGLPFIQKQGADTVLSAFQHVIANDPNVAALRTKAASTQFMKAVGETYDATFMGSEEKLSFGEQMFVREVQAYKRGEDPSQTGGLGGTIFSGAGRAKAHLHKDYKTAPEYKLIDWMATYAGIDSEKAKGLLPGGTLAGSNPDFLMGAPKQPSPYVNEPFLQPTFSFQSNEGLLHKMQQMGGMSYDMAPGATENDVAIAKASIANATPDAAQATVSAIGETNKKLDALITIVGSQPNRIMHPQGSWSANHRGP